MIDRRDVAPPAMHRAAARPAIARSTGLGSRIDADERPRA